MNLLFVFVCLTGNSSASPQPTTGNPFASNSREQKTNEYTMVNTASTMRVLNVLRHWLTKHPSVTMQFLFIRTSIGYDRFSLL